MLKHTETQLVPFEDCGFARYPELPLTGEPVTVRCKVYEPDDVPLLRVTENGKTKVLQADEHENGCYAFHLGSRETPARVAYQFFTGTEETPVYTFDVHTARTLTQARVPEASGGGRELLAGEDLLITVDPGEQAGLRYRQLCSAGASVPGTFSFTGDGCAVSSAEDGLLSVSRGGETLLTLTSLTVLRDSEDRIVKITENWKTTNRHVLGTGERFHRVDQAGSHTSGSVTERFTRQGDQTYLPVPFFMTEKGWGWYTPEAEPAACAFGESTFTLTRETEPFAPWSDRFLFGEPRDMLAGFLRASGGCALPPEWAFGVWISGNGWNCDAEVDEQLRQLKENDYPASVMVLEQWSDERTFHIWNKDRFPAPEATVARIREAGLHPVLWQIPVIKYEWDGEPGPELQLDEAEAVAKGYVVQREDGTPYRVTERWFHNSLLPDFSDPDAAAWWFGKRQHLLDIGIEGFKTDGGEFLFDRRVRLHDGTTGPAAHNRYPMLYEKAYADFLKRNNVNGVIFSRAGYTGAQTVPIHWAGDQVSEWSELRAQLTAGITAGLSGVIFWSFDIGGFAGPIPEPELYLRATAMACFCPVMQWHSEPRGGQFSGGMGEGYNNDRSPWNLAEKWHDPKLLEISTGFARLRETLRPYLWREARRCAAGCRPMMAHLCLDWPDDPRAWCTDDEYMLGHDLLVAPVTEKGVSERTVWLPRGEWEAWSTGDRYTGGREITAACPIGSIPVFRKVK
ncbi:MAG: glycoside hydrolase family 31 protein [Clostridia bacterium]|nr:glycoside hydrolase family 31 protein [Clostridia bacterium]